MKAVTADATDITTTGVLIRTSDILVLVKEANDCISTSKGPDKSFQTIPPI